MAFLCPSRRSRQKKKKKEEKEPYLGRITGSSSVDTLVRVGLEKQHGLSPESRMTVLDDFSAGADDELNVESGQTVYMLYTEQEWMYVLVEDGREGFIPRSFAKPCRSPALRKRVPPTPLSQIRGIPPTVGESEDEGNEGDQSNSPTNSSSQAGGFPDASIPEDDAQTASPTSDDLHQNSLQSEQEGEASTDVDLPEILPFEKRDQGKWVAVFAYDVEQESDVRVTSGEVVTLLNAEDKQWYWVRRSGGAEGFVPRSCLCKLPDDLRISHKAAQGVSPVFQKAGPGHHRSQSMTDQPMSLPAYLRPTPHRPLSSNSPILSSMSPAGSANATRPSPYAASATAGRPRPHSSIGSPTTSLWNPNSAPVSSVSSSSGGPVFPPSSQTASQRPHSSMGYPITSSLSHSQSSASLAASSGRLPLSAASSAASRILSSSLPANQISSLNHQVSASQRESHPTAAVLFKKAGESPAPPGRANPSGHHRPPPLSSEHAVLPSSSQVVQSSPAHSPPHVFSPASHAPLSSHSASHDLPSSSHVSHSPYSATHVPPSSYSGTHAPFSANHAPPSPNSASQVPPSPYSANHVPPSSYSASHVPPSPYSPSHAPPSPNHVPPPPYSTSHAPQSPDHAPPSQYSTSHVPPSPYSANRTPPSLNQAPPPQHSTSHVPPSPYSANRTPPSPHHAPPPPYSGSHAPPSPYSGNHAPSSSNTAKQPPPSSSVQSQSLPSNPYPSSNTAEQSPPSSSVQSQSLPYNPYLLSNTAKQSPPSSAVQFRSPPSNPHPSSNTVSSRFASPQHRQTNPPRLSSSLNQSQDGRRTALEHRNSLPEQTPVPHPRQQHPAGGNVPHALHVRRSSLEPFLPKGDAARTRAPIISPGSSVTNPQRPPGAGAALGRSQSPSQFRISHVPENVTELVTLHSFSSRGTDDMSVSSDEVVYGDLGQQPERDWLWVYSPRLERHGYIPRNIVTIPGTAAAVSRSEGVARV